MKVPFSFGLSFFFRVLLPGFFWSIFSFSLVYPVINKIFGAINLNFLTDPKLFLLLETILVGIIINALDYKIYQTVEGRILWPKFLFKWGVKKEEKYIQKLTKTIDVLKKNNQVNSPWYLEAWYKLRMFPINKNSEYEAVYPTRLGNVIHGYESYTTSRYGIDVVFWWYRTWLMMDKDTRGEIDRFSAIADFVVYSSLLFYGLFVLNLIGTVYSLFNEKYVVLSLPSYKILLLFALVSLISGIIFYKVSLSTHRFYGEFFKSIFDIHRNKILNFDRTFTKEEKIKISVITRYLQYHKIRCPECNHLNAGDSEKCSMCGEKYN